MRRAVALACLLLGGCGAARPPSVSQLEARCELDATKTYAAVSAIDRYAAHEMFVETCMRAEGYVLGERTIQCGHSTLRGPAAPFNPDCYFPAQ